MGVTPMRQTGTCLTKIFENRRTHNEKAYFEYHPDAGPVPVHAAGHGAGGIHYAAVSDAVRQLLYLLLCCNNSNTMRVLRCG